MVAETEVQERETLTLNKDTYQTDKENSIEAAQPEDIPQIITLCYKEYFEVLDDRVPEPKMEYVYNEVERLVADHLILVKRDKENPSILIGVAALQISNFWWNPEASVLTERFFYIDSEHRSLSLFNEFIEEMKSASKTLNMDLMVNVMSKQDKFDKILNRKGFEPFSKGYYFGGDE